MLSATGSRKSQRLCIASIRFLVHGSLILPDTEPMRTQRRQVVRLLVLMLGAALCVQAVACRQIRWGATSPPDSVTVRIWHKSWSVGSSSSGPGPSDEPDWGWDSTAVRVAAGGSIWPRYASHPEIPGEFIAGRLLRRDSIELVINSAEVGARNLKLEEVGVDTVLLGTHPIEFTSKSACGGFVAKLAMIPQETRPTMPASDTCTVKGRVIFQPDTGSGGRTPATVAVLWTKLATRVGLDGSFILSGVSRGEVELLVRPVTGYRVVAQVVAPTDRVIIRVDRAKAAEYARKLAPPAAPIPVPAADSR